MGGTRGRVQPVAVSPPAPRPDITAAAGRQPHRKYHNIVVREGEQTFDSQAEYGRWQELQLLVRAGQIRDLRHHVVYRVRWPGARRDAFRYEADFVYWDTKLGREVVEDVKSPATQKSPYYRLKKRLLRDALGIEIAEVVVGRKPRNRPRRAA